MKKIFLKIFVMSLYIFGLATFAINGYAQVNGSTNTVQTGAQWGLDRIDQRNLPLSTTYNYAADGSGVNVYIVDSGIRSTHQEFGGVSELVIMVTLAARMRLTVMDLVHFTLEL